MSYIEILSTAVVVTVVKHFLECYRIRLRQKTFLKGKKSERDQGT